MLTKRIETGKIEILVDGALLLREDTVIEEDGVELSRTFHRTTLEPSNEKVTHADPRVGDVSALLWTPDVVTAYAAKKQAKLAAIGLATIDPVKP